MPLGAGRSRLARVVAAAVGLFALVFGSLATPSPAAAATIPNSIALVSQTPWVTTTAGMQLEIAVSSQIRDASLGLQVTLYSQATERGYFEESLSGDMAGFAPIASTGMLPLSTKNMMLPNGDASIDLPVSAPGIPGPAEKPPTNGTLLSFPCTTGCPGVYPLQVSLGNLENATTLDSFMTYLVLAPNRAKNPLRFSWILPVGSAPATTTAGTPAPARADERELEQLAGALSANPAMALSLELYPQFSDALGRAAASKSHATARGALQALHELVANPNVGFPSQTYTPLDLTGFARAGLLNEVGDQFQAARTAFSSIGVRPSATTFVAPTAIGTGALSLLSRNGVSRVVVPSASVTPVPSSWIFPVWAPFLVSGTNVEADASDYYLERHLASSSDPTLRANQMLADLALLYFSEQPEAARGVSLLAPLGWHPTAQFLSTIVSGLATSPIVKPVTMSQFFDQVPPGSAERQLLHRGLKTPHLPRTDVLPAGSIETARSRIEALASLTPKEATVASQLRRQLLLSESASLSLRRRLAYLSGAPTDLAAIARQVSLPSDRTITITSLNGRIPVSIYSKAKTPMHVDLVVRSVDLSFRRNRFAVMLEPGNNTFELQVFARTAGDFQLNLEIATTAGSFRLASGNLVIRSTAISAVAVGLTAGAAAFLIIWWGRSVMKRRRRGRHLRGGGGGPGTTEQAHAPSPT